MTSVHMAENHVALGSPAYFQPAVATIFLGNATPARPTWAGKLDLLGELFQRHEKLFQIRCKRGCWPFDLEVLQTTRPKRNRNTAVVRPDEVLIRQVFVFVVCGVILGGVGVDVRG